MSSRLGARVTVRVPSVTWVSSVVPMTCRLMSSAVPSPSPVLAPPKPFPAARLNGRAPVGKFVLGLAPRSSSLLRSIRTRKSTGPPVMSRVSMLVKPTGRIPVAFRTPTKPPVVGIRSTKASGRPVASRVRVSPGGSPGSPAAGRFPSTRMADPPCGRMSKMSLSSPPVMKVPPEETREPSIVTMEPVRLGPPSGSLTVGRSTLIVMVPLAAEISPPAACVRSSPASSRMLPLVETMSASALTVRLSWDPANRASAASRVMSPSAATSSVAVPSSATVIAPSLVITIDPVAVVLTAPCSVPTVPSVSRPLPATTLSISMFPPPAPLFAARVLTSVSSESPLPIPVTARISSVAAVMLFPAALLSLMAAPASRITSRVALVTSSSAILSTSAMLIVPDVLLTALRVAPLMSMSAVPSVAPPPMPVAASRSTVAPVMLTAAPPSPVRLSVMVPTLSASEKSLSSAETVTLPAVVTMLSRMSSVASSSIGPLAEEIVTPSAMVRLLLA